MRTDRQRFALGLGGVMLVGLVLRVAYVLTVGRHLTFGLDSIWYELEAGTLARGQGYIDPAAFYQHAQRVPTANFPPLWPFALSLVERLGFHSPRALQLAGAAVGTVTVGLAGLLGRRVAGRRVGLVAAALVASSPMLVAADGSIMAESLYTCLVTAALLAGYAALRRPTAAQFALVGALLGLASLTRSDGLILVPILAGALGWRAASVSPSRRLALGGLVVAAAVLVLVPWTIRDSQRLGQPVLVSSNSGNVLVGGNCASTYFGARVGAWDASCVPPRRAGATELAEVASDRRTGLDYARSHLGRLPAVAVARVLRTWGLWNPVQQTRIEVIESRYTPWQLVGWAYDLALLAAAAVGAVRLRRRGAVLAPLVAVVVAVCVAAAISNGNQRFRLAAAPAVAVAAAVPLADRGRRRSTAPPPGVLDGPAAGSA